MRKHPSCASSIAASYIQLTNPIRKIKIFNFVVVQHPSKIRSHFSLLLLLLFFATVVGKDFYHGIGHKTEHICTESDNHSPHFHALDKCVVCDQNFSCGDKTNIALASPIDFIFGVYYKIKKDQNASLTVSG